MELPLDLKPKIEALLIAADRSVKMSALIDCLQTPGEEVEAALAEFETDLMAADRGIQLRRRGESVRIETKGPYADLIGRLFPERRPKPLTKQARETLMLVALKQPITTAGINAVRNLESAGTVATLRQRKLIARERKLGPHREMVWRTTQRFLDTFNLDTLEELFKDRRLEELFGDVYGMITADAVSASADNEPVAQEMEVEMEASIS